MEKFDKSQKPPEFETSKKSDEGLSSLGDNVKVEKNKKPEPAKIVGHIDDKKDVPGKVDKKGTAGPMDDSQEDVENTKSITGDQLDEEIIAELRATKDEEILDPIAKYQKEVIKSKKEEREEILKKTGEVEIEKDNNSKEKLEIERKIARLEKEIEFQENIGTDLKKDAGFMDKMQNRLGAKNTTSGFANEKIAEAEELKEELKIKKNELAALGVATVANEINNVKSSKEEPIVQESVEAQTLSKGLDEEVVLDTKEQVEAGSVEALKKDADRLFEVALEKQAAFQKTKGDRNAFNKLSGYFGIGKKKEGHVNKDFEDNKAEFEKAEEAYRAKYSEFANQIIVDKKTSLGEGKSSEELKKFIMTAGVVEGSGKDKEGKDEKLTLFEHMNQNEQKLLAKRAENLNEKKKGTFGKAKDWYGKRSKAERFAISLALSASIGAGAALMMGGGLAVAASCFGAKALSDRVTKKLLMMVGIGGVVGLTAGALKWDREQLKEKNKNKAQETITANLETESGNIFEALDGYNKKIKNKERNNKILIGLSGFTAVAALGQFDVDDLFADNEIPFKPTEDLVDSHDISKGTSTIEVKTKLAGLQAHDNFDDSQGQIIRDRHTRVAAEVVDVVKNKAEIAEKLAMNNHFELAKGGTVSGNLLEHFDGNKESMGKALAGFRKETFESLTKGGMTDARANEFIKWRYEHMDVGTNFNLAEGDLKISGFVNEKMLDRFEVDKPEVDVVDEKILGQAKQDEMDRMKEFPREDAKTGGDNPDIFQMDPIDLGPEVDDVVNKNVDDIYRRWGGGNQRHEWEIMKERGAQDILDGKFGNPIGIDGKEVDLNNLPASERGSIVQNPLDLAEINNREELQSYMNNLKSEVSSKLGREFQPISGETVESFIKRAEQYKLENPDLPRQEIPGVQAQDQPQPPREPFFKKGSYEPSRRSLLGPRGLNANRGPGFSRRRL